MNLDSIAIASPLHVSVGNFIPKLRGMNEVATPRVYLTLSQGSGANLYSNGSPRPSVPTATNTAAATTSTHDPRASVPGVQQVDSLQQAVFTKGYVDNIDVDQQLTLNDNPRESVDVDMALLDENAAIATVPSTFSDHDRRVLLAEIHLYVLCERIHAGLISHSGMYSCVPKYPVLTSVGT